MQPSAATGQVTIEKRVGHLCRCCTR